MNKEWTPKPIPPFRRIAKNTVIIRGLPTTFLRPNITRVDPAAGNQGQTLNVTVSGSNFVDGAVAELLGGGIVVHNAIVVDQYKIIANISVDPAASLGARDAKVTNPGGLNGYAKGAFTVREEPDCFPSNFTTYADWVTYGKPDCWCQPPKGSGYQCDGDCDGKPEGALKYRVFSADLRCMIEQWKRTIAQVTNPCADFDHKPEGAMKYRVFTKDLGVLVTNWKKKDAQLPGNCPRPE
jgi:hypothetical protein